MTELLRYGEQSVLVQQGGTSAPRLAVGTGATDARSTVGLLTLNGLNGLLRRRQHEGREAYVV